MLVPKDGQGTTALFAQKDGLDLNVMLVARTLDLLDNATPA